MVAAWDFGDETLEIHVDETGRYSFDLITPDEDWIRDRIEIPMSAAEIADIAMIINKSIEETKGRRNEQ